MGSEVALFGLLIRGAFAWGCGAWAKSKGRSPVAWAISGFFFAIFVSGHLTGEKENVTRKLFLYLM